MPIEWSSPHATIPPTRSTTTATRPGYRSDTPPPTRSNPATTEATTVGAAAIGNRSIVDLFASLLATGEADRDGFVREAFGEGWLVGPDGCDVRDKVLAEAWDSGADAWSPEQREQYANDTRRPDALIAVTDAMNQSKSDRDPAEVVASI